MQLHYVHNDGISDHWACKRRSTERCSELILSEDRPEVVWVDYHIVTISPFRVDVPASCQGVWLHSEASGAKVYDQIELIEVFGPPYLPTDEIDRAQHSTGESR